MAPHTAQQLLQDACQQLKYHLSAAVLAQPGPFDPQAHISNFLQNLGHRQPSPSDDHRGPFRLHFPFPFSGLFFRRERKTSIKNTQVSDSQALTQFLAGGSNGDLESRKQLKKQVRVSRDGEEEGVQDFNGVETVHTRIKEEHVSVGDGTSSHGSHISGFTELHLLQMQLDNTAAPASKEVLGRATWTFLHTLAAQFPENPTRQQQRDAKELMAILSRIYPCKECADHFKQVLKANPVQAGSGAELAQWMCSVHNVVNRSLGKPIFPCQRVDARWGAMDCDEGACNLQGRMH